ncbi:MAG: NusG domain II-containing protein [Erysipelotrichaceae bacterium]|nr:NusG domain II-containing protein [Erysipelotrichaceae bacterium]
MKKKELYILLFVFLIGAVLSGLLYFRKSDKTEATVYLNDEVVMVFDITEDATYSIQGDYGILNIEVKDNRYRVFDVDCPNHDCEKVGWVDIGSSTPIVCLPNHIYIVQE